MKLLLVLALLYTSLMASTPVEYEYSSAESTPIPKIPPYQHIVHTSHKEILQIGYIDIVIPAGSKEYQACFIRKYKELMDELVLPSMTDYYLFGLEPDTLQRRMHENALELFNAEECMLTRQLRHLKLLSPDQAENSLRFVFKK